LLVLPGGGYHFCSKRESEPVAMAFYSRGYNVFVLDYVQNHELVYPEHLEEACLAVGFLKDMADFFHIDKDRIFVIGFSAGGHLAASLGIVWNRDWIYERTGYKKGYFKTAGMILCYPVISSDRDNRNEDSFRNLLKERLGDEKLLEEVSLEKQVDADTVPAYIWHTSDDPGVNSENSVLMALALTRHKIPYELHVFPHGPHGMSLCDEQTGMPDPYVARWVDEAAAWMERIR